MSVKLVPFPTVKIADCKRASVDIDSIKGQARGKSLRGFMRNNKSTMQRTGYAKGHSKGDNWPPMPEGLAKAVLSRNTAKLEAYVESHIKRTKRTRKGGSKRTRKSESVKA